jgi:hypothetical protein
MRTAIAGMAPDKAAILDALLDTIERDYPGDIAVAVCYGSVVTKNENPYSDLDFFFIPKTPAGYAMSAQFILDGIGYDFWPVSWEFAERLASFAHPFVSLIADGHLVYAACEEDADRYEALLAKHRACAADRPALLAHAGGFLREAKLDCFELVAGTADEAELRARCLHIADRLLNAAAYLNGRYVRKGLARLDDELAGLAMLPPDFARRMHALARGAAGEAAGLIVALEAMMRDEDKSAAELTAESAKGFYEELKSAYNKLYHACQTRDCLKAICAADILRREARSMLGEHFENRNFPELLGRPPEKPQDFDELAALGHRQETMLVALLREKAIAIREYSSLEGLRAGLARAKA